MNLLLLFAILHTLQNTVKNTVFESKLKKTGEETLTKTRCLYEIWFLTKFLSLAGSSRERKKIGRQRSTCVYCKY